MELKHIRLGNFIASAAFVVCAVCAGISQNAQPAPAGMTILPGSCEESEAYLDAVGNEARSVMAEDDFLIAVARRGDRDRKNLGRERLSAVKKFFIKRNVPARSIVIAEGERADGLGRVEFYVSGRLFRTILARPDGGICVECCNPAPKDFYLQRRTKKPR